MKLTSERPFADPDKAVRRLMQHAHTFEPQVDVTPVANSHGSRDR
jgi:hypothetical protein